MNEDTLLSTILETSFVKADVLRRIRLLREYLEQRFYTSEKRLHLDAFLKEKATEDGDHNVMASWGDQFYEAFTKETAYSMLDAIATDVKALPMINIYMPFAPDSKEIDTLGRWVRKNVDKNILIEIHVDPQTLGGCAFAWGGVYRDYSLRHMMAVKEDSIRAVIANYVKS